MIFNTQFVMHKRYNIFSSIKYNDNKNDNGYFKTDFGVIVPSVKNLEEMFNSNILNFTQKNNNNDTNNKNIDMKSSFKSPDNNIDNTDNNNKYNNNNNRCNDRNNTDNKNIHSDAHLKCQDYHQYDIIAGIMENQAINLFQRFYSQENKLAPIEKRNINKKSRVKES